MGLSEAIPIISGTGEYRIGAERLNPSYASAQRVSVIPGKLATASVTRNPGILNWVLPFAGIICGCCLTRHPRSCRYREAAHRDGQLGFGLGFVECGK